ncbi:MAG: peptide/nickel transport system ATP-binding protein [Candidatus Atribacteria bacterium]|nr:peptide/nickel transport system ATP-binding protein [Candidatus Atribacteria bacterium]
MERKSLLIVRNLRVYFYNENKEELKAVDGVNFEVREGETLALVGESGCGKSVTSLAILRLIDPNGLIKSGEIIFQEQNLLALPESKMQEIRGKEISMIFQEPATALNPVYTVGDQIMEAIMLHQKVSRKEAERRAEEMLRLVGIPEPRKRLYEYPHELSGGMKQRAMIAMALSCHPKLLIADEPTTSLDVTIQAQILELIKDLQKKLNMAVILITHDLGIVADFADRVVVMYAGKIVEEGTRFEVFKKPTHPYTLGLLRSIPRLDTEQERLESIPGMVPDPLSFPEGCRFRNRCAFAETKCAEDPPRIHLEGEHFVYCHFWQKINTEERARG